MMRSLKTLTILPLLFFCFIAPVTGFSSVAEMPTRILLLPRENDELRVAIDYRVTCAEENPGFGAVRGEMRLPGRTVRFDLYLGNHHTEVLLGRTPADQVGVFLNPSATCLVSSLDFTVSTEKFGEDLPSILKRYSPFFVVRKDQVRDRDTDVPLSLTYNIFRPSPSRRIIQYSLYYTDEDTKRGSSQEESQMARYGRRLDIQWAYRVEIDARGEKVREWFQGGILRTGIGHKTFRFRGDYLPATDHPVLYDISDNNVYSDKACFGLKSMVGYAFAEMNEIPDPASREEELFRRPWMLKASDLELAQEGKLAHSSLDYLYVLVHGEIKSGALTGRLELSSGETFLSGGGNGSLDRLGEDTWEMESFTAVPVGHEKIQEILLGQHGPARFSFTPLSDQLNAHFTGLRFFTLSPDGDTYRAREVTEFFRCLYPLKGLPSCEL